MNPKTREVIDLKIEAILRDYRFEHRSKERPEECPCYQSHTPCHDLNTKDLNCFFCMCPEYDNSKDVRGCLRKSPQGKWYNNPNLPQGQIWDCSDCDFPHRSLILDFI